MSAGSRIKKHRMHVRPPAGARAGMRAAIWQSDSILVLTSAGKVIVYVKLKETRLGTRMNSALYGPSHGLLSANGTE